MHKPLIGLLQIPTNVGSLRLDGSYFLQVTEALGIKVHYWVINELAELERLLDLGVDGLVTDRIDRAYQLFIDRGLISKNPADDGYQAPANPVDYFLPPEHLQGKVEVHTCISLTCQIANSPFTNLKFITLIAFAFVWILLWIILSTTHRCCCSSQHHNSKKNL